jgi:hypothetical protein
MIKTETYKHNGSWELDKYIERRLNKGYELISCSTRDIFWTFSIYLKESTLVWEI